MNSCGSSKLKIVNDTFLNVFGHIWIAIVGEQMIKTSGGQTVQQIFRHLVPLPPGGIVKDSILKEMDKKGKKFYALYGYLEIEQILSNE